MLRKSLLSCIFPTIARSLAMVADTATATSKLSAAQLVERNVSARGGLQA